MATKKSKLDYSLTKFAANEGLGYLASEFASDGMSSEIQDILNKWRKSYAFNIKSHGKLEETATFFLDKLDKTLSDWAKESNALFSRFTKSVQKNREKREAKFFEYLGDDYVSVIQEFFPNVDPYTSSGQYQFWKVLVTFANDPDGLINKAKKAMLMEPKYYEQLGRTIRVKFSQDMSANMNYDWVDKYANLFKFAQELQQEEEEIDVEFEELTKEDLLKELKFDLSDFEKRVLSEIVERWQGILKGSGDYMHGIKEYMTEMQRLLPLHEKYVAVEKERNQDIQDAFNRVSGIKHMLETYKNDGGSEEAFYKATELTFKNAVITIDRWVDRLFHLLPREAYWKVSKTYYKKAPKELVSGDKPGLGLSFEEDRFMKDDSFGDRLIDEGDSLRRVYVQPERKDESFTPVTKERSRFWGRRSQQKEFELAIKAITKS